MLDGHCQFFTANKVSYIQVSFDVTTTVCYQGERDVTGNKENVSENYYETWDIYRVEMKKLRLATPYENYVKI